MTKKIPWSELLFLSTGNSFRKSGIFKLFCRFPTVKIFNSSPCLIIFFLKSFKRNKIIFFFGNPDCASPPTHELIQFDLIVRAQIGRICRIRIDNLQTSQYVSSARATVFSAISINQSLNMLFLITFDCV